MRHHHRARTGFTLVETVVALSILATVVLTIGLGTVRLGKSVGDANIRTRAFARADVQIAMGRAWPTWSTLERLAGAAYNGTNDGLVTSTAVVADTTNGRRLKRLTVTVDATRAGLLPTPVRRTITIAAP